MKSNTPSFDSILEDIDKLDVSKVTPKKIIGRPKGTKRLNKEQAAASQAYIAGYESVVDYRPEPKRLIVALSLPEDQHLQALEDALLPRQLAFCREYILDFKQKAAAIRAGYSPRTAEAQSHNLMQYRGIKRLIHLYTQSKAEKITTVDANYVIQKVTEIIATSGNDSAKLRGLELLARHLGMFIERTEITGKDGEAIRIEETQNKADEVARRLRQMGKQAALSVVSK